MTSPSPQSTYSEQSEGLRAAATLNNGVAMPWLGLGVFQMPGDAETAEAVSTALKVGYRSIDTAAIYRNERGVGDGVRASGLPRSQVFVTTKVWNDDMRAERVEAAFDESLQRLGFDYVDLYLLHWPIRGHIASSWRVLESIHRSGRARAIGVSNFMIPHLDELLHGAEIVPAVNQIEYHPYLQSPSLSAYCRDKGIQLEAWSPLQQAGDLLDEPVLREIARIHSKTVAQVILRWDLQSGVATIPKSVHPSRIRENAGIFDFTLTAEEMTAIAQLDRNERNGADPFNFDF